MYKPRRQHPACADRPHIPTPLEKEFAARKQAANMALLQEHMLTTSNIAGRSLKSNLVDPNFATPNTSVCMRMIGR